MNRRNRNGTHGFNKALLCALCIQLGHCARSSTTITHPARSSNEDSSVPSRRLDGYDNSNGYGGYGDSYGYGYDYGYGYGYESGYGDEDGTALASGDGAETPSPTGSSKPTPAPSPHPTNDVWTVVKDAEDFLVSTCGVVTEDRSGSYSFTETIDFEYYLYLSDDATLADAEQAAATAETLLHAALTRSAIVCSDDDDGKVVTALSSKGMDVVMGECNDITPEASQSCWQISAQITATIASSLSDSQLVDLFSAWIEESLEKIADGSTILRADFQGFSNVNVSDGKETAGTDVTSSSSTSVSELNLSNIPADANTRQPLGLLVLALAAIVLLLLTAFLLRRRNRRQKAFVKYVHDAHAFEVDDPPIRSDEIEPRAIVVNDDEQLADPDSELVRGLEDPCHDPRKCCIEKCELCRQLHPTVFVPVRR